MKFLVIFALLLSSANAAFAQNSEQNSEPLIVAGKGWGAVQIDAKRETVEAILGKGEGDEGSKYLKGVYFREYPDKGIQVSYTHQEDTVVAIFFTTSSIVTKICRRLM